MSQIGCEAWVWNATRPHSARMTIDGAKCCAHLTADDLKEIGVAARSATGVGCSMPSPRSASPHRRQPRAAVDPISPTVTAAPSRGERRQLTVMFCDLVGSTALSEKLDPEELRSLLHAYRTLCGDVIARYDGFVARYVGDGILTYFGWPTAHEEDAERAVRAALEIVHTVKRASSTEDLSVRIGIATGPVVVGERPVRGTSQSWRWAARPIWPRVCKDWPPPTRSSSPPRPVDWSAMRLN